MSTRGTELGSINNDLQSGWRKASKSYGSGHCVEIAAGPNILVRDSKDRGGATIVYPGAAWRSFTSAVRSGDFQVIPSPTKPK